MKKKPDPKTLLQLFTEDHPDLLSDQFCECHCLQICPTAWMKLKPETNDSNQGER
tara:strand:+ start:280 stop:444 length:165 start_codon:yes stop_codon:yes gene_type:complete